MCSRIHAKCRNEFRIARIFCVLQRELFDFLANILPSNFYNAKTISGVAKWQSFIDENLFVDAVSKGHFSGYVSLPKNFSTSQLKFLCCSSIPKN
jgi:hypothetical protein